MTLRYALFASFGSRSFFGTRLAFFAALGAIYGFGRSRAWRAPERQRRVTVGLRRRTHLREPPVPQPRFARASWE